MDNTIGSIFIILIVVALGVLTYLIFRARLRKQKEELKNISSTNDTSSGSWKWSFTDQQLQNQVANYNNLPLNQSARGVATLLILFAIGLTLVLNLFNIVDNADLIGSLIIYLPLAFFIYKGHRWAMIGAMVMWTIDKAYQMYTMTQSSTHGSPVLIILWWLWFMSAFYKAYQVEQERRKGFANQQPAPVYATKQTVNFCRFCGNKIFPGAKFCTSCGKQLI